MPDNNIENLGIKISVQGATAKKAQNVQSLTNALKNLDKVLSARQDGTKFLVNSLNQLSQVNVSKIINQLNGLYDTLQKFSNLDSTGLMAKLDNVASSFRQLSTLANIGQSVANIRTFANSVNRISTIDTSRLTENVAIINQAMASLSASTATLADFSSSAKGLSDVAQGITSLSKLNGEEVSTNFASIAKGLKPLTDEIIRVGANGSSFASAILSIKNLNSAMRGSSGDSGNGSSLLGQNLKKRNDGLKSANNSLASIVKRYASLAVILRKVVSFAKEALEATADWTENLNLFAVTFRDGNYDEVLQWVKDLSAQLNISMNQLLKFTGNFKQLSSSLGVSAENGELMSKTLTQLALDFSSFYNQDIQETFEALQSGIFGGQTKPMRTRFGIEVAYQSLDDKLNDLSHTYSALYGVSSRMMTQAQKSILRTIQTLESGRNAFGDYANTIDSLSNQIKVFEQSVENLKLAFGDLLMYEPFQKILVYINGCIVGLTQIIRSFQSFREEVATMPSTTIMSEIEDETEELNNTLGKLSFDYFESLQGADSEDENLAVTEALTKELEKQSALYEQINAEALANISNKVNEIGEKIKNWFVTTDENGITTLTENAEKLLGVFKLIGVVVAGMQFKTVGALVAGFGLLYTESESFRESVNNLVKQLKPALTKLLDMGSRLWDGLEKALDIIMPPLTDFIVYIVDYAVDLFDLLFGGSNMVALEKFLVAISETVTYLLRDIKILFQVSKPFLQSAINLLMKIVDIIADIFNGLNRVLSTSEWRDMLAVIEVSIIKPLTSIVDGITNALEKLQKIFSIDIFKNFRDSSGGDGFAGGGEGYGGGGGGARNTSLGNVNNGYSATKASYAPSMSTYTTSSSATNAYSTSFKQALYEVLPPMIGEIITAMRSTHTVLNIDGNELGSTSSVANGVRETLIREGKYV